MAFATETTSSDDFFKNSVKTPRNNIEREVQKAYQYYGMVKSIAMKNGAGQYAEEIMQEIAILASALKFTKYTHPGCYTNALKTTARNLAIDFWRKDQRDLPDSLIRYDARTKDEKDAQRFEPEAGTGWDVRNSCDAKRNLELLEKRLRDMIKHGDKTKAAAAKFFCLRFFRHQEYQDIAKAAGVTTDYVYTAICRLFKDLHKDFAWFDWMP